MGTTIVHQWDDLAMVKNPNHPELYQKTFLNPADADHADIRASMILYEKLEKGGAVLPHYHDVCEIICVTKGRVQFYCETGWVEYHAYDTFIVSAGQVHSVTNIHDEPSEQISFFVPAGAGVKNEVFKTTILEGGEVERLMKMAGKG
ncbi:cupin domain-containing protein [Treponema primitia]|uniref:cupin domain-containing protein n=1 Tax=Treponema primitia TaxID=88058 RepID=UPI0002555399|nr:cupin domain-containing protein [Treponema primitia]